MFSLEKNCLKDKSAYPEYQALSRFRESVKNNPSHLKIKDFGAGSKRLATDERKIADILKYNCTSAKRTKMMFRIAKYFKADRILELGTSLGVGTHALATARPEASITSLEGSPAVAEFAQSQLEQHHLTNVQVITGSFADFLDGKLPHHPDGTYDLIFIDGHHDGPATLDYFEKLLPFSHPNTVFILDDIYWSADMTSAWRKLTKHPKVTASVDSFQWGLLFLRKEQLQESFYIKV
ncbi:O-methyltransferase [Nonlabens xiamenensis]|uniref:O-methyltransferase n=1 Tax=Nonlabens xiamenensis TaxID=2341043 RepID=UPI001F0B97D9|nr:class I SAM-dependent methyltransferase [Nonlabens xiamenensis]